jgi:hypothetical protein
LQEEGKPVAGFIHGIPFEERPRDAQFACQSVGKWTFGRGDGGLKSDSILFPADDSLRRQPAGWVQGLPLHLGFGGQAGKDGFQ